MGASASSESWPASSECHILAQTIGARAKRVKGARGMKRKSRWRDDCGMKQRWREVGWHRGWKWEPPVTPPIAYGRHDGAKVCNMRDPLLYFGKWTKAGQTHLRLSHG